MTFPEDENQKRPMSLYEAMCFLIGDFTAEEKPISKAPEPPIPTKHQTYIKPDPSLWEAPRSGVPREERDLIREGGWGYPNYELYPFRVERGGIKYPYPTTTTNTIKKEPVTTKREEILDEAKKLITSDRQEQYGPPEENFQNIADVWNIRFKNKLNEPFTPADVAAAMALLKIVRDMAGYKEDSAIDAAAYIALYAELSEKEPKA